MTNDSLTEKYSENIYSAIQSTLDITNVELIESEFSRGELSQIMVEDEMKGYLLIAEVAACNLGGCPSFDQIKKNQSSEYFDLMMIANEEMEILDLKILDYFSDYGYEVTSKKYLKKFRGKQVCAFSNRTDGIDAISGATISSYALEGILSLLCTQ